MIPQEGGRMPPTGRESFQPARQGRLREGSSTWRLERNWKSIMRKNGVVGIIDKTPELRGRLRGEEIETWLAVHPEVKVYAILDDENDMLAHQPHFKTSFCGGGLTER